MKDAAKILVVEGETAIAMTIACLLSSVGCNVKPAFTGQSGMQQATKQKFDLILLDVDLLDINGFDICLELKQRHISYRTPIILLSRNNVEEHRAKAFQLGAADFIAKPFNSEEFIRRAMAQLGRNNSQGEEFQMQDAANTGEEFTQSLLVG